MEGFDIDEWAEKNIAKKIDKRFDVDLDALCKSDRHLREFEKMFPGAMVASREV